MVTVSFGPYIMTVLSFEWRSLDPSQYVVPFKLVRIS